MGFQVLDWCLFSALILISLGVGVFIAVRGQGTTDEVLMGNRNLSLIPVTLSIFMSFLSAISVLGNSAEMYQYGAQMWRKTFGFALGYMLIPVLIVPILYNLQLTSSFEVSIQNYTHS